MVNVWPSVLAAASIFPIAECRIRQRQASTPTASSTPTPTAGGSCAQQAVFANSGFESGLSPWIPTIGPDGSDPPSNLTIVSPGHNSNKAVQISVGYAASIGQNHILACTATKYTISFDYQVLNASDSCSIDASAGTDKFNTVYKSVNHLSAAAGEGWKTASFAYLSDIQHRYNFGVGLTCPLKGGSATVQLDNVRVAATGSLDPPGCPQPVTVPNGGFESGQLAPWKPAPSDDYQTPGSARIVSPGFQSSHAIEMDFPQNSEGYYVSQQMTGLCIGQWYLLSFAANWLNTSSTDSGCVLSVLPPACQGKLNSGYFHPGPTGWRQYSYACQASAKGGIFDLDVSCTGASVAPFGLQLDAFSLQPITSASASPSPTPSTSPTSSSTPNSTSSPTPSSLASSGQRLKARPRWT